MPRFTFRPLLAFSDSCRISVEACVRACVIGGRTALFTPCLRHGEMGFVSLAAAHALEGPIVVITGNWPAADQSAHMALGTEGATGRPVYPHSVTLIEHDPTKERAIFSGPAVLISTSGTAELHHMLNEFHSRFPRRHVPVLVDMFTTPHWQPKGYDLPGGVPIFLTGSFKSIADTAVANPLGKGVLLPQALRSAGEVNVSDHFSKEAYAFFQKIQASMPARSDLDFERTEILARNATALACAAVAPFDFATAREQANMIEREETRSLLLEFTGVAEEFSEEKCAEIRRLTVQETRGDIVLAADGQAAAVFGKEIPKNVSSLDSPASLLTDVHHTLASIPLEMQYVSDRVVLGDIRLALRDVELKLLDRLLKGQSLVSPVPATNPLVPEAAPLVRAAQVPSLGFERISLLVRLGDGSLGEYDLRTDEAVFVISGKAARVVPAGFVKEGDEIVIPNASTYEQLFRAVVDKRELGDPRYVKAREQVLAWKLKARERYAYLTTISLIDDAVLSAAMKRGSAWVSDPNEIRRWLSPDLSWDTLGPQREEDAYVLARFLEHQPTVEPAPELVEGVSDFHRSVRQLRAHRRDLGYILHLEIARLLPEGHAATAEGQQLLDSSPRGKVMRRKLVG